MTIAELQLSLRQAADLAGLPDANLEARRIIAHVLEHDEAWLRAHALDPVAAEHAVRARALLSEREKGVPLPYLTNAASFLGMPLHVNEKVLVPRPETETFLERILAAWTPPPARVADVGTGSGAIALALAKAWPDATVIGIDVSADALAVAWANGRALELPNVTWLHGDLLAPLAEPVDAVVANLPYLTDDEMASLPPELAREPRLALAGGPTGDTFILRLIDEASTRLCIPGRIALEVHPSRSGAIAEHIRAVFPGAHVAIENDLLGLARFVFAEIPA